MCNDYTGCACKGVCKDGASTRRWLYKEAVEWVKAGKDLPSGTIVEGTPAELTAWREFFVPVLERKEKKVDETNPKDLIGVTKSRLDLVPPALAISAAPAMELGARKYGPYNWRTKAVRLTVYLGAIDRHLAAYRDGQDTDPESGYSHLGHVAACLAIIADAKAIGKLIDDRPPAGGAAAMLEEQVAHD